MRDMKHERRAAEDRRIDKGRRDAEIFAQCETRGVALRRRADQAVDIAQLETQSASARWMPCAIRSIGVISLATAPKSDSAMPTIAAEPRCSPIKPSPAA